MGKNTCGVLPEIGVIDATQTHCSYPSEGALDKVLEALSFVVFCGGVNAVPILILRSEIRIFPLLFCGSNCDIVLFFFSIACVLRVFILFISVQVAPQ